MITLGNKNENATFSPGLTYPGFGRNWDIFLTNSTNLTFKAFQRKVFEHKKFQIPCRGSKVPN